MNETEKNAFMRAFALAIASQRGFSRERLDVEMSMTPYFYYDDIHFSPYIREDRFSPISERFEPQRTGMVEITLRLRCTTEDSFMRVLRSEYNHLLYAAH